MYEVILSPVAQKVYVKADKALTKKIERCLQQLEQTPRFHPNIKPLKVDLAGCYRYRIGDYRIIYEVQDKFVRVLVLAIVQRGEAYKQKR